MLRENNMGHTCNSIIINAPYEKVFDISNDIPRWTELFGGEYKKAEVLEKKDNKITFRLTDEEDKSWVSWRLLFKDKYFAYAQRHEPLFPFKYMKIIWLYTPKPEVNGLAMALAKGSQTIDFCLTEMTWIQHFEMDDKAKFNDQQIEGFINEGSKANLKIFKEIIEKEVAA
ncbi:MAG: SRPBCC family protein [Candidatus Omnitrophota bacterium]|nr:SRPBCC family protein [Candidatus Omnitrophota bacterium]